VQSGTPHVLVVQVVGELRAVVSDGAFVSRTMTPRAAGTRPAAGRAIGRIRTGSYSLSSRSRTTRDWIRLTCNSSPLLIETR
jgi:hypothetical protein